MKRSILDPRFNVKEPVKSHAQYCIMTLEQCVAIMAGEGRIPDSIPRSRTHGGSCSPRTKGTPSGCARAVSSPLVWEYLHRPHREGTVLEDNVTYSISPLRPFSPGEYLPCFWRESCHRSSRRHPLSVALLYFPLLVHMYS